MLDSDLARLYQVETKFFNQAVKRNLNRFPEYFRFQLTEENKNLRPQFVTSSSEEQHGGRGYLPYVYTEQEISMFSAVLKSEIAICISMQIMDAFVKMRRFLVSNAAIFERLDRIELKQLETDQKFGKFLKYIEREIESFNSK